MKRTLLLTVVFVLAAAVARAEDKPAGIPAEYHLLYSQDFTKPDAIHDFLMADPSAWSLAKDRGKPALALTKQSKYKPPYRSPFNFALIRGKKFADCTIDAELYSTSREYPHRDMVIVFGYQSPSQFYYVHIASGADEHANNVFLVKEAERVKIAQKTNKGNNWGQDAWHKVRVERLLGDGTIKIYFDDLSIPIMIAEDKNFGPGWVGFGSFDDTGEVTSIRIWGPKAEDSTAPPFPK